MKHPFPHFFFVKKKPNSLSGYLVNNEYRREEATFNVVTFHGYASSKKGNRLETFFFFIIFLWIAVGKQNHV